MRERLCRLQIILVQSGLALSLLSFYPGNAIPARGESIDQITTAEEMLALPESGWFRVACVGGWILNRIGKEIHSKEALDFIVDEYMKESDEADEPIFSSRAKAMEQAIEGSKAIKSICPGVK